ncbi:hypothetical protein PSECIP111951_01380 [Pseudoalteromonas holothuriae]|uniref:N-acetyltransferase domain-containing protein n=1 Tax=Pseudoalteromonas holothuriae TaxID=2963714 RepID=A0ABM9GH56_9GAMM|nr:GNAT family N-acetyltransferase [Pseudoalteromonas sp. CIP111951]CAH9056052.1 hypothetical protein PSECIP111951_01380 [Pseudoalteromonas sp. CIP111951]
MANKQFSIKKMTKSELNIAIEWAAKEGWNPGLYDAQSYYCADPNGFLIGYLDDEPIASISVVKYTLYFGFLGFYIVKPEYRGQGYGWQIWQAGLSYLKGCNIALDGVLEQQENYKKSGFQFAYSNIRFEGRGGSKAPETPNIVQLANIPFEVLCAYEQPFFPAKRDDFLKHWINQPQSNALGIMRNDKLAGYGVIRPCRQGYKIGPLVADEALLAESLFLALSASVGTAEFIYLDVPEVNKAAIDLAQRYNMAPSFETARMYTGPRPDMQLSKVYGITSFEIG